MLERVSDLSVLVATIIGFLVLVWVAVCVFFLMLFTVIMAWDHIQKNRHKSGRHDRRDNTRISENQLFFEQLREDEEADAMVEYAAKDAEATVNLFSQPKSIAERKAREALIAEQRERVGYSTPAPTPVSHHDDATMVYPRYDPEQTVVGMTPRYTPPEGVLQVGGEDMLHPYPFNLEDNNDATRDRPA